VVRNQKEMIHVAKIDSGRTTNVVKGEGKNECPEPKKAEKRGEQKLLVV